MCSIHHSFRLDLSLGPISFSVRCPVSIGRGERRYQRLPTESRHATALPVDSVNSFHDDWVHPQLLQTLTGSADSLRLGADQWTGLGHGESPIGCNGGVEGCQLVCSTRTSLAYVYRSVTLDIKIDRPVLISDAVCGLPLNTLAHHGTVLNIMFSVDFRHRAHAIHCPHHPHPRTSFCQLCRIHCR